MPPPLGFNVQGKPMESWEWAAGLVYFPLLPILYLYLQYVLFFHFWDTLQSATGVAFPFLAFYLAQTFSSPFLLQCYLLDTNRLPAFAFKHRLQGESAMPSKELYDKALKNLLEAGAVTVPGGLMFCWGMTGERVAYDSLPTAFTVFWQIALASVFNEVGFYTCHRILHSPYLYKRIHKVHHEFKSPVGACAFYAHPIEHQLQILPIIVGVVFLNMHVFTGCLWFSVAYLFIVYHHSGYQFGWTPGDMSRQHDLHHEKFNGNYGVYGWMDMLCGTWIDPVAKKMTGTGYFWLPKLAKSA